MGAQCGALDTLISRSHRGHQVPLGVGPQQLPAPWVRGNHLTEVVAAHGQECGGVEVADGGGAAELLSNQRHQLRRAHTAVKLQTPSLGARMGKWGRTAFSTAQSCSSKCRAFVLAQQPRLTSVTAHKRRTRLGGRVPPKRFVGMARVGPAQRAREHILAVEAPVRQCHELLAQHLQHVRRIAPDICAASVNHRPNTAGRDGVGLRREGCAPASGQDFAASVSTTPTAPTSISCCTSPSPGAQRFRSSSRPTRTTRVFSELRRIATSSRMQPFAGLDAECTVMAASSGDSQAKRGATERS